MTENYIYISNLHFSNLSPIPITTPTTIEVVESQTNLENNPENTRLYSPAIISMKYYFRKIGKLTE